MAGYIGTQAVSVNTTSATITGDASIGGNVTLNEGSADVDFRVESVDGQHSLFVEGSTGNIGMFGDAGVQAIDHYSAYTTLTLGNTVGGTIQFEDDGVTIGQVFNTANDLVLESTKSDGDVLIKGNDGGASITALTFDMSAAGLAKFNAGIAIGGTGAANTLDDYEEGSFNLTMVGSNGNPDNAQTLSSQYVKVGKLVSFRSFGTVNNTGATGQLSWNGLPFSPTGVCIVNIECNKQATFSLSPYGYISGTVIYIQQMRSETTYVAINHNTATSGEWSITGCFHTNS